MSKENKFLDGLIPEGVGINIEIEKELTPVNVKIGIKKQVNLL